MPDYIFLDNFQSVTLELNDYSLVGLLVSKLE